MTKYQKYISLSMEDNHNTNIKNLNKKYNDLKSDNDFLLKTYKTMEENYDSNYINAKVLEDKLREVIMKLEERVKKKMQKFQN